MKSGVKQMKYYIRTFDPETFKRHDRIFTNEQRAMTHYNTLIKKGWPVIIHILSRNIPGFQVFDLYRDENKQTYSHGSWKPYFDHKS